MNSETITLEEAITFTVGCHSGQYRKGSNLPYIVHPMAVLSMLGSWGIQCPITLKAAIGHDVLEDCSHITFEDCVKAYGHPSALIIQELSFFPVADDRPVHIQKQAYMDNWMNKSVEALIIKMADRCCNTLDFMNTDRVYAWKYWQKAQSLRFAVYSRNSEIKSRYSSQILNQVNETIQNTEEAIERALGLD